MSSLDIDLFRFEDGRHPYLRLETWSNAARAIEVRGSTKHQTLFYTTTTNADRSRTSNAFRIPDLPLWVVISPTTAPNRRGETYVRLTLEVAGFAVARLIVGYVTDDALLTWPPGVPEGMISGRGLMRIILGTDPAAGVNFSETVPTNARWQLHALRATLVTSATVANRVPELIIDDGTLVVAQYPAGRVQVASETVAYNWGMGLPLQTALTGASGNLNVPHPAFMLLQGWRARANTVNLNGTDNWGAPLMLVEEWIEE